ncbi:unnamed protein product [Trifolium pratense]|uniref:Uncharacterized protein n=1 Tax=Trifolium pratense TaxID=57577 RepID=A0ACB0MBC2_TRIPR|nr:unnamed protein product [Trifolium pratense]
MNESWQYAYNVSLSCVQRNFLWGGGLEDKKLCWVKWDQVCRAKEQGGLGVKNLELFNIALLSKWKWRAIIEKDAIWADLLNFRYGCLPAIFLSREASLYGSKASLWWRDVFSVGESIMPGWFRSNTRCIVGNGAEISFWNAQWHGDLSLGELFPNLFAKELRQNSLIADRLSSSREGLVWKWEWCDVLTQEEEHDLLKLKELLLDINLNLNCADRWRWIPGDAGLFSVKSCYNFLVQLVSAENLNPSLLEAVKKLWKNDVPSKVNVFGWRLLLEKLPTRDALASKGIITNPHETCCVFCFRHVEDCCHIFYHCKFSQVVWSAIFKWLGCSITIGEEGLNHFFKCGDLVKGHRVRHLIWLTTNWCLWRLRNNIIFRGEVADVSKLIDNIMTVSWIWFSGRAGRKSTFSFADWCTNPIACLQSI